MLAMKRRRGKLAAREQAALRRALRKLVGPGKIYPSFRKLAAVSGWDVSALTRTNNGESGGSWAMFEFVAAELGSTVETIIGEHLSQPDSAMPLPLPLSQRANFTKAMAQAKRVADFDDKVWSLVGQTLLPLSENVELSALELIELAKIIQTHRLS